MFWIKCIKKYSHVRCWFEKAFSLFLFSTINKNSSLDLPQNLQYMEHRVVLSPMKSLSCSQADLFAYLQPSWGEDSSRITVPTNKSLSKRNEVQGTELFSNTLGTGDVELLLYISINLVCRHSFYICAFLAMQQRCKSHEPAGSQVSSLFPSHC